LAVFGVLVAVLGLLAVSCGPAATPESNGGTGNNQQSSQNQQQGGSGTSGGQTSGGQQTASASVSGIPLDPDAKFGGVLHTAYQSEGPSFSQWEEAGGVAPQAGQPLTNMLVQPRSWGTAEDFQNQAYFEIHPDLAASWEQSQNGLQWTFKLRDGIEWSDGQPFTCADVKWSFDTIRTGDGLARSPRAIHFLAVDNIQCPDDLTVVFNLKRPKPGFLEVVAMPYHAMLPKHVYENNTDLLRQQPHQAGTGPFLLSEYIPGELIRFTKKEDYWNQPFPYVDEIEARLIALTAQPASLRAGRIDIGPQNGWSAGAARTITQECSSCQAFDKVWAMGMDPAIMVNHQRAPWNLPEIKDALSLAIDRKKYVQVTLEGFGTVPEGGPFFPGGYWAMPKERLAQIPGYDFDNPEGNKQRARELLAQAGFEPGELVIPFSVGVYNHNDVPSLVEDWTAVGFRVEPTLYEVGRTYELMSAGTFDVFVHGFWVAGYDPDVQMYEQFYTGSDRNYNRYSNPQFDQLVDEMSQTLDPEERRRKAWDAAEIALRDQAKIITSMRAYQPIIGGRVRGWMPATAYLAGYGPWHRLEHVWLAE
jgi:peptide/nickel transport system substrate-binding protein